MSDSLTAQSIDTLMTLRLQLERLLGGSLPIGGFATWFNSLRWDSSSGFNTQDLAPLGWAIETSLYEYAQAPQQYEVADLVDAIDDTMGREELVFPEAIATSMAV